MASKKVTGLTIEIGASTTKLSAAMKQIKTETKALQDELKTVDKALKFDPTNTQLLAQKMDLLTRSADLSEKKIKTLEAAQKAANKAVKDGSLTQKQAADACEEFSEQIHAAGEESKRAKIDISNLGKSTGDLGVDLKDAGKGALSLGTLIKGNIISSVVIGGLQKVGQVIKSIGSALWNGAKAAAKWTLEFGKASIEAGANLKEIQGSTARLFEEEDARALDAWAGQGARTMGLSKSEALAQANTLGNLFINKGLSSDEAAYNSMMMVQRAADIGANFNMSTSDVMTYFQQMLKGVYSGADAIGIVTNASAVNARAMQDKLQGVDTSQIIGYDAAVEDQKKAQEELNEAIKKYGSGSEQALKADEKLTKSSDKLQKMLKNYVGELTEAEKAMAGFNIAMEQSFWTDGTFAEEAKGYSGALKIIDASIKNIKEKVGVALLPAAEAVVGKVSEYFDSESGKKLIDSISGFLGNIAGEITKWIDEGGLEGLEAKVEGVIGDISAWFADDANKEQIRTWLTTTLPEAVETAKSAVDLLVSAFQTAKDIILGIKTAIENTVKAIKEAQAFIDSQVQKAANGSEQGEYNWEDSGTEKETELTRQTEFVYGDGWGNYDFSGLEESANTLKQSGQNLEKEESKITKDAEKFAKDTPAAMDTAVRGTQSAADGARKVSFGEWWKKVEELTQIRKNFENEVYLAKLALASMPEGGSGGSGGNGSGGSGKSSGGGISGAWNTIKTAYQTMLQKLNPSKNRATGGVVVRGVPTMVGEAGREIEIPSVNGNVLSHWQTEQLVHAATTNHYNSGGNVTLQQYITVNGSTAGQGQRLANDFVSALRRKGINPTKI